MIVKTFTGSSLRDALQRVRESLGADAVILDTHFDGRTDDRLGTSADRVSVTAAYDRETESPASAEAPAAPSEGPKTLHVKGDLLDRRREDDGSTDELAPAATTFESDATQVPQVESIEQVIRVLTAHLNEVGTRQAEFEVWAAVHRWLVGRPELVSSIADSFATDIAESLPPIEPFLNVRPRGQNVLLVGERGVGKSTALFKALAARWKTSERKPHLRIVSEELDHGQERLETLCERCDIAFAASAFERGRLRYRDGRHDGDAFAEFVCGRPDTDLAAHAKAIRRRFRPEVVALVLNAAGTPSSWHCAYERFHPFGLTHVVFTHWDECQPWWEAASFSRLHTILLSYRTHGFEPFGEIDPLTTTDLRAGIADHVIRSDGKGENQ